jgi:hypothetical protein
MTIRLGQIAPDFEQDSTQGPIHFHEWLGDGWALLFSHPTDRARSIGNGKARSVLALRRRGRAACR